MSTYIAPVAQYYAKLAEEAAKSNLETSWIGHDGKPHPVFFVRNEDGSIWQAVCYYAQAVAILARNRRDRAMAKYGTQSVEWITL